MATHTARTTPPTVLVMNHTARNLQSVKQKRPLATNSLLTNV